MSKTKIEWAEETINPFVGCQKASAGCDNCYALRMAWRLAHNPDPRISGKYKGTVEKVKGKIRWTGRVNEDLDCMEDLYKGPKGKIIFVGSMGDITFENLHFDLFAAIMDKCYSINNERIHYSDGKKAPHQFMFLTKRPERFAALWKQYFNLNDIPENRDEWQKWPLHDDVYSTFWIGVTAENQEQADARIPVLLSIPAAKRFVSIEPMLGPVDLDVMPHPHNLGSFSSLTGIHNWGKPHKEKEYGTLDLVICGGESGPGARPVFPEWVRGVRDQCKTGGVPFFFKQWGQWAPMKALGANYSKGLAAARGGHSGRYDVYKDEELLFSNVKGWAGCLYKVGKKAAGRLLDGKEYLEWPE